MFKKFFITSILVFSVIFSTQGVFAVPAKDGKLVRVGISNSNFKEYYFNNISVSATDEFTLIDKKTNALVGTFPANEDVKIVIDNNLFSVFKGETELAKALQGPVVVSSDNGFVTVSNLKRAGKPAYYKGTFEITKAPSKNNLFNVINVLDLQSYLRGVVPNEMPVRFGHEALKAQAVLARNYVLKPREKNYHNFDVCDSVACQVYYGANTEKDEANLAIDETENIVAMYNGELILALYSSTSGGYTENYENAFSSDGYTSKMFPGIPVPYLKGVPDNPKTKPLNKEEDAKEFYTKTPETFDNASPYFRWQKEWDLKELEDVLKKTLKAQSAAGYVKPVFEKPEELGNIKEIKVIRRGVSGKAMSVNIITDKGTFNVQKELPIRRAFQKNNIGLPSANVFFEIVDVEKSDKKQNDNNSGFAKKVVAYGGGFGHGVGMSQWGAGEMANQGYSYQDIIQHYYYGTSIATYPINLSIPDGEDVAVQTFYTENKKANLVIDNRIQYTDMTIVVNAQELRLQVVPTMFKPEVVDISPYLVKGENKITYILPYENGHKKPITLYVELCSSKVTDKDVDKIEEKKHKTSNKEVQDE